MKTISRILSLGLLLPALLQGCQCSAAAIPLRRIAAFFAPTPAATGGGGGSSTLLNNLAVYYNLNEVSGNRSDSSANAQTLTDNNSVSSTNGVSGNAAVFASANSKYLSHADSTTLSVSSDFTIAFWFNPTSGTRHGLMEKGGEYDLQVNNSSHVEFIVYDSVSGNSDVIESSTTIAGSTWYFVVAWYNSADKKAHIKVGAQGGSLSSQADAAAALTNGPKDGTSNFYLGYQSSASFYDGSLDEFGLWKRVLTGTEITTLYGVTTYPF